MEDNNNIKLEKILKVFGGFSLIAVVFSFYVGYFMSQMQFSIPFVTPLAPSTLGNNSKPIFSSPNKSKRVCIYGVTRSRVLGELLRSNPFRFVLPNA